MCISSGLTVVPGSLALGMPECRSQVINALSMVSYPDLAPVDQGAAQEKACIRGVGKANSSIAEDELPQMYMQLSDASQ